MLPFKIFLLAGSHLVQLMMTSGRRGSHAVIDVPYEWRTRGSSLCPHGYTISRALDRILERRS